jgi:pimeloyl-ACP methyl ester carboxylesterase
MGAGSLTVGLGKSLDRLYPSAGMAVGTPTRGTVALIALVTILAAVPTVAGQASTNGAEEMERTVESFDGTEIDITVCKPAEADASDPVPVILHSHGWAGSKSSCSSLDDYTDAGFGAVSISQRGHGDSGGQAHVHDPDIEGQDNIAVLDHVESLDWVETDDGGDPLVGAVGGSYGGGYQLVTAFTEIRDEGKTRLDALAPQITWHNLMESLAPDDVVRSVWVDALYAAGAGNVHQGVHEGFAYATATGQVPDGTAPGVYNLEEDFLQNGPNNFVDQGLALDMPVLFRQGLTDNLFNLNQAVDNYQKALTPSAQADSLVIGYNGGHALPNVFPPGVTASGDPCTEALGYDSFTDLTIDYYEAVFDEGPFPYEGESSYQLATPSGECVSVDSVEPTQSISLDTPIVTPTAAGAAYHVPLADGPLTVAGVPQIDATVTTLGADARAFFSLSAGTSPADARVLSNNVMPIQELAPVLQEDRAVELAGVTAELAEDEQLFLTVSPVSDMFVHHGSRTPGALLMEDVSVQVPLAGN